MKLGFSIYHRAAQLSLWLFASVKATLYKAAFDKANKFDEIEEAMDSDHIDRVVQPWKAERPDYDLAPVEIIGRAGRIMVRNQDENDPNRRAPPSRLLQRVSIRVIFV
jgi:hypothetical protein